CPLTDFGGKTSIFSHPVYLFLRKFSLQDSRGGSVELNGITYQACRGDFVVRLDGSTCLQLWNKEGRVVRLEGDPLEVAQWLQACHDAGIEVRVQINESSVP
ncbi:hypothetical protein ACT4IZ_005198, partial [Escherichia coli]